MPPPESDPSSQAAANNSSDFVRKLYKMLEDPAYNSVVRWGNEGDSFVVLENEKFTKTILPKHFKHSNFASFVRQLNKYDFHKVRHNEETGQSAYGQGAWEFKHPEFRQHKKDNLDNIRRKAPTARKTTAAEEPFPATQQVALLNDTLAATQHQVQALQEQFSQMSQANKVLLDELLGLQKVVKAQYQVNVELTNHLNNIDEQRRRNGRLLAHGGHGGPNQYHNSAAMLPDSADEPAIELRRAREILNNVFTDPTTDRELERLTQLLRGPDANKSPPESAGSSSVVYNAPNSALSAGGMTIGLNDLQEMRHLVYPVGQNAGIDPFHEDHIHNIPYTRPLSDPNTAAEGSQAVPTPPKELGGALWGPQKPRILLVEDDKVCARIGAKFLSQVDCKIEIARDGSEAVAKVNQDPVRYDLIFMDIIMPVFDGVSATACIRIAAPRVPVVAMTSNIRNEDIATYFHWGMNDVLAKPFTKEGMVRILKKQLPYLLKNPPLPGTSDDLGQPGTGGGAPAQPAGAPGGYMNAAHNMGGANMGGLSIAAGVKFETTPIQSPATSSSWQSPGPNHLQHGSPSIEAGGGGYMTSSTNGGGGGNNGMGGAGPRGGYQPVPSSLANAPLRAMGDGMARDDRPDKRQRLYGPGQHS